MPIKNDAPLPKYDPQVMQAYRDAGLCPICTVDWLRMPELFDACKNVIGGAMYNFHSKRRQEIDRRMAHSCNVWKQKYMAPCSAERQKLCVELLEKAVAAVKQYAPTHEYPYLLTMITKAVNTEESNARQKALVPKQADLPFEALGKECQ